MREENVIGDTFTVKGSAHTAAQRKKAESEQAIEFRKMIQGITQPTSKGD
jgi:hypothetical protein